MEPIDNVAGGLELAEAGGPWRRNRSIDAGVDSWPSSSCSSAGDARPLFFARHLFETLRQSRIEISN
jgi:hypothetical protein